MQSTWCASKLPSVQRNKRPQYISMESYIVAGRGERPHPLQRHSSHNHSYKSSFYYCRSITISPEKELTQYLMENYEVVGRGGRPVIDFNQTTLVEFGLGLIQIDLDESEKVLTTSMWTRMVSGNSSMPCFIKFRQCLLVT